MPGLSFLTACAILFLAMVTSWLLRIGRRPKGYPPGPPTLPIIGNIHQLPAYDAHVQFKKWAEEYGPIFSLILGAQTLMVISSDTAVKDLLDKRSNIYSDRMKSYIGMDLCSGGLRMLFMPYGTVWRKVRKMCHNLLNVKSAVSFIPYQSLESLQLLHDLLSSPVQDPLKPCRRFANSVTTSMVYGWRIATEENKDFNDLFTGFDAFVHLVASPAAALMDCFPILRNLPDWAVYVKAEAKRLHVLEKALYMKHWLVCKGGAKTETSHPSFCRNAAKLQEAEGLSDSQLAYQAGTLLEAGSDTTSNTLYGFVQAMIVFPEAQKLAQEEIDRVVGPDRLPTMEDEPNMPYVRGCVKETLRWMPTTPTGGMPHCVTQDDEYMGYHIPRGAGVMINVWAIHTDPNRYPEPRRFDPSRYLNDHLNSADSAASVDVSKRDHFTFGAGRRVCQGMHVAERSLFLAMSRLLWTFQFSAPLDANGKPTIPDIDKLTPGFVTMPEPYQCRITPRNEQKRKLVEKEWDFAQQEYLDEKTRQWRKVPEAVSSLRGA